MVREISWTKNIVIMERCKDDLEREFYIKIVKKFGWTKDVLINNLENNAYHKYLLNQTNFDENVPEKYRLRAKLSVKDDYNFDFLEMGLEHSEAELETAIIRNIRAFLSEMGDDFTFVGNQYHISTGNKDFYIDLLLFHRRLKSLIAIELKIGEFEPEYALKSSDKPIGVATYNMYDKLPDELKNLLPEPNEIAERLTILDNN